MFTAKKSVIWLAIPVMFFCIASPVAAQINTSFQYFYDDLGQLTKVVDSTGTVIEYVYDPVGNILQIKRSTIAPSALAIFNFTPQRGGAGQIVTIQGQGFDPMTANDSVQFKGTVATVLSASTTTLTVVVPASATTGPISLTAAGQTVTSAGNFTVLPVPVITSLSRKSALLGASFPNAQFPALTVTGINLTPETSFTLAPATSPPAATFGIPAIDPSGTSALMSLKIGTGVTGTFALVASNFNGSSSVAQTKVNRFTIVDPRSTADTDGNGLPDVIKAIFGVDVLDPIAFPILPSMLGQAESPAFTVLNSIAPRQRAGFQAESPAFTVLNSSVSSSKATFTAESPAFSVENSSATRSGAQIFTAESPLFSLLNGSPSSTSTFAAESILFLVLNSQAADLLRGKPLLARNAQLSSPTTAGGAKRALHPKKAHKTKTTITKLLKAGRAKTAPSSVPDAQLAPAASQNETKVTDQQGVANANQNK